MCDLKAMIKDSDAHIFIEILKKRREVAPGYYYYAYELDEENRPNNVFLCDF